MVASLIQGRRKTVAKKASKQTQDTAEEILDIVKKTLDAGKAEDVALIDLAGKTSIASYMVVASGTSNRHVAFLAESVRQKLKEKGYVSTVEGEEKADWVLIDVFDVIVHIFRPEVRDFYSLEKMWSAFRKPE